MTPAVQDFLLEWLGKLLILGVVVSSFVAVYFVGRGHGRQAQRRANVLSAVEDAAAVTVVLPRQRGESS